MQKSSQPYTKYCMSFDRAFNTRQNENEMFEIEQDNLPPLESKSLVESNPVNRERRQKQARRGQPRTEQLRDIPLKPVVIRGSQEIQANSSLRVHLPPINVNLQVQELLAQDKSKRRHMKSQASKLRPLGEEEIELKMKEFTVLPPIGMKGQSLVASTEVKKTKQTDDENETFGLQEALISIEANNSLEKLKKTEADNQDITTEPSKFKIGSSSKTECPVSYSGVYLGKKSSKDKDVENLISGLHEIVPKRERSKVPLQPPDDPKKRGKNIYQTDDTEEEFSKNMIEWCRETGRRNAIVKETHIMYNDLAVIVKHNLLIQHLEEICMF